MPVELTEEFDQPWGDWTEYDAYQAEDRTNLATQEHVDLRSLDPGGFDMWSGTGGSSYGQAYDGALGGAPRLTMTSDGSGLLQFTSIGVGDHELDLSGLPEDTDLSIAFPSFPADGISLAQSYVALTSDPLGSFTGALASTVNLDESSVSMASGTHREFRFNLQELANRSSIDLARVTGVRIAVQATLASRTVKISAIRALRPDWKFPPLQVHTRSDQLRKTVSRTGDPTVAPEFNLPILWRSASLPGEDDPRPIDVDTETIFNTGTVTGTSSIKLYFRELTEDFLTQLDLNGETQAVLDGRQQPDTGEAKWRQRLQEDLERELNQDLEGETQFSLERVPDYLAASWTEFNLAWSTTETTITIVDTEGNGHWTSVTGLQDNTDYVLITSLEENRVRGRLHELTNEGIGDVIIDTLQIADTNAYKRRKGRFGWNITLTSQDTFVNAIRERNATYAEYRSLAFCSITPVEGAELSVDASSDVDLYETLAPYGSNLPDTILSRSSERSTTGESWKIEVGSTDIYAQGVRSNSFLLRDFDHTEFAFDLFYPSGLLETEPLVAKLVDTDGRATFLNLPKLVGDQWERVRMKVPREILAGRYYLALYQANGQASTWWIDGIRIFTRSIVWEARAITDDPWFSNDARWTRFEQTNNRSDGGVVFPQPGTELQVRARARRQGVSIGRIQFRPKYAELGRILPGELAGYEQPEQGGGTIGIDGTNLGNSSYRFAATTSFPAGRFGALYEWSFSDGAVTTGSVVEHTYTIPVNDPPIIVRLTVTDNLGYKYIAEEGLPA